jgi:hypothetical protein
VPAGVVVLALRRSQRCTDTTPHRGLPQRMPTIGEPRLLASPAA